MPGHEGIDGLSRICKVESLAGCTSCFDGTLSRVGRRESLHGKLNAISLKAKLIQTFVPSANIFLFTNNTISLERRDFL